MSKKSLAISFLIVFSITVCVTAVYLYGRISADEDNPNGTLTTLETIKVDFYGDGREETVELEKYQSRGVSTFYIKVDKPVIGFELKKLSGFEDDVKFCPQQMINASGSQKLICLFGDVGVHSQNIQLISYESGIKIIPFVDGERSLLSVYTDAPKFDIKNAASERAAAVCLFDRDYDKDPLIDTIEICYYFSGESFNLGDE